jgi:DNA-directed RNA polymerase specialized sigma24 family protein
MEEKRKLMQTRKYDLKRVLPLTLDGEGESADYQLTSDDPSPSRPVLEDEAWKQLSSGLSSDEVELIERRREGATYKELAALRKCNVKTIQRFFDKLREERGLS